MTDKAFETARCRFIGADDQVYVSIGYAQPEGDDPRKETIDKDGNPIPDPRPVKVWTETFRESEMEG